MSSELPRGGYASVNHASTSDGVATATIVNPTRVKAPRVPVWSYLERKVRKYGNRVRTRWRVKNRPRMIRLGGVRLAIDRELYSAKIIQRLYDEGYEREERVALERTVRPTDRVLELGAGIGYLSAVVARRIGGERVTTCEANPDLLTTIAVTHELNGVRPAVLHGVMSRDAGIDSCRFYSHRDLWSSSLRKPKQGEHHVLDVPTLHWQTELDRLQPTYLLMDIEGGEIDLLEAFECPSVERMLIEFHPKKTGQASVNRVFSHLTKIGFVWAQADRGSNIYYFER
ncbi:FkbM family methyltransferase [Salinisphaera sp.]|uniref:FkbM family methyltransferase n=1 Tax=Salinisphaera sp. TaxID=1914330 RepID=UPI002D770FEE|nr:FkbM family methyltransferase [Salinisphaera sp.]HET7315581.1 FkbM family methyltransferase [Salinisphaera sp.]